MGIKNQRGTVSVENYRGRIRLRCGTKIKGTHYASIKFQKKHVKKELDKKTLKWEMMPYLTW